MKLFVDLSGDRHYLVTDDGEAVYLDDLREDGRDTGYLEQAADVARARARQGSRTRRALDPLEIETYGSGRGRPE